MSVVDYSIDQIVNGVTDLSPYLLKLAFDNPNTGYQDIWGGTTNDSFSIEQGIREKVIYKMIQPLINAAGGNTEIIDLSTAKIRNLSAGIVAVNVPDYLTGGRRITSVLEIYPGNMNRALLAGGNFTQAALCNSGGTMGNAMSRVINGLDNANVQRVFTNITMTGNNSFIIRDVGAVMFSMLAKVVLSYDEHFSTIPPKAWDKFAELVELGVKVYIYKNCRRGMQEAVSRFGVSIDEVRDDIEGYRDAHKEFRELSHEEIKKYLAYADPKGVTDTLFALMPRRK